MLQNATPLRKSAPWPPNSSYEHVTCIVPATWKTSCKILCIYPSHACHRFRKCYKTLTFCSLLTRCIIPEACQKRSESVSCLRFCLRNMLHATTACTFSTSQLPNLLRHWGGLYILHMCTFQNDFAQHDPRNRPFMGFEGSHSAGEIGMGGEREKERKRERDI